MSLVDNNALVSGQWLLEHLNDDDVQVFDCTVHLQPRGDRPAEIVSGHTDYLSTHIPGAGFLDLTERLSDTEQPLPFTLPHPEALAAELAAAGVDEQRHIVLYSSSHAMWATRLWWMLKSLGVPRVAVLDGGLAAWDAAGRPLASGAEALEPGRLQPDWNPAMWASKEQVLAQLRSGSTCTINALPAAVYRGESPVRYGRPGHISGSVNVPYENLFARNQQHFAAAEQARSHLHEQGALSAPVVCYCGGGIAATVAAFVLNRLGHEPVAVYDGSLNEWTRDPEMPMTLGHAPGHPGD